MYSAEYFHSSASPAQSHFPSRYFAPRAGNICLASEWSLAVQIGAGRGAHCRPANDESVCPLSWRRRKLLLLAPRSTHTPRETDFQTYAVCF